MVGEVIVACLRKTSGLDRKLQGTRSIRDLAVDVIVSSLEKIAANLPSLAHRVGDASDVLMCRQWMMANRDPPSSRGYLPAAPLRDNLEVWLGQIFYFACMCSTCRGWNSSGSYGDTNAREFDRWIACAGHGCTLCYTSNGTARGRSCQCGVGRSVQVAVGRKRAAAG